ncbi:hypothetical protein DFH09DRAFT_1128980 [Mycena vulgaris]|nr:hypothetical protein DFH09DRAFT_1128980 [Mycena vulgaris]
MLQPEVCTGAARRHTARWKDPRDTVPAWPRCTRPDVGSRAAFDPSTPNTARTYVNQGGLSHTTIFNKDDAIFVPAVDALDVPTIHAATARPFDVTARAMHDLVAAGRCSTCH